MNNISPSLYPGVCNSLFSIDSLSPFLLLPVAVMTISTTEATSSSLTTLKPSILGGEKEKEEKEEKEEEEEEEEGD